MRSIDGVGRAIRAHSKHCSSNPTRYEIAATPHPAALHASSLPIKGRVGIEPYPSTFSQVRLRRVTLLCT